MLALGQLLHSLRRRRALEGLRNRPRPASVLVVCHGNICRSPFAAALLGHKLAPAGVRVDSAGFVGPNRPCPPAAVTVAAGRGVALDAHRSRLLTPEVAHSADLIVVMDAALGREVCGRFGRLPRDILVLGDLDPRPLAARTIRDPVNQGVEVFEESYGRIERCLPVLVRALALPNAPADRPAARLTA